MHALSIYNVSIKQRYFVNIPLLIGTVHYFPVLLHLYDLKGKMSFTKDIKNATSKRTVASNYGDILTNAA